jgi:hypothetical protein
MTAYFILNKLKFSAEYRIKKEYVLNYFRGLKENYFKGLKMKIITENGYFFQKYSNIFIFTFANYILKPAGESKHL